MQHIGCPYLNKQLIETFHNFLEILIFLFALPKFHQTIPPEVYVKNNLFSSFFDFWFPRYCLFKCFFLYLTFAEDNFAHHATYGWKALEG